MVLRCIDLFDAWDMSACSHFAAEFHWSSGDAAAVVGDEVSAVASVYGCRSGLEWAAVALCCEFSGAGVCEAEREAFLVVSGVGCLLFHDPDGGFEVGCLEAEPSEFHSYADAFDVFSDVGFEAHCLFSCLRSFACDWK